MAVISSRTIHVTIKGDKTRINKIGSSNKDEKRILGQNSHFRKKYGIFELEKPIPACPHFVHAIIFFTSGCFCLNDVFSTPEGDLGYLTRLLSKKWSSFVGK